jgi:glycerol-3-phosphate acyltransferase PlsY
MPATLLVSAIAVGSYLFGSIPFGYLIARARGVNIFEHGSGNIGATNVGRVLGKRFGLLAFLLDFMKGSVPVLIATWLSGRIETGLPGDSLGVIAGLAAFLGHLFPIYLRFRGGKGVATGAGIVAVLVPWPALAALLTWALVVFLTRYVSLGSLCAVVVLCLVQVGMDQWIAKETRPILTLFCLIAAALVFVRHRSNITRLAKGIENRI